MKLKRVSLTWIDRSPHELVDDLSRRHASEGTPFRTSAAAAQSSRPQSSRLTMSLVDLFPPEHKKKAIVISFAVVGAVFVLIMVITIINGQNGERPPPPS